jgi:hypothetical protein
VEAAKSIYDSSEYICRSDYLIPGQVLGIAKAFSLRSLINTYSPITVIVIRFDTVEMAYGIPGNLDLMFIANEATDDWV